MVGYIGDFTDRVIIDAITQATVHYWVDRARLFDDAAHVPGVDWPGHASRTLLEAQQGRCQAAALACRYKAAIIHLYGTRDGP